MASVPNSGSSAPPPPVWDAQPAASQVAYGGFWIRFVAYIIDAIILGVAGSILGAIFGIQMVTDDIEHYDPTINLVSVIIAWLYFALFESSARGATPGKILRSGADTVTVPV